MSIAAVTMVWNDAFFLRKWVSYYGTLLGARNLYVISHGENPYIRDIPGDFNVIQVPRDPSDPYFDRRRWALMSHVTSGLTRYHRAVLCLDVDEIILPAAPGKALVDVIERLEPDVPFAVPGFEVFPRDEDVPDTGRLGDIAGEAAYSVFYSKAVIAQKDIEFYPGGHGVMHEPFQLTTDLMLMHLKYLHISELDRRSAIRAEMAIAGNTALEKPEGRWRPFKVWKDIDKSARKAFEALEAMPQMDWPQLFDMACTDLKGRKVQRGDTHIFFDRKKKPARGPVPDWARVLF